MTETERVAGQIGTLSILYYVYAALHLVGMCAGGIYVALGGLMHVAVRNSAERTEGAEYVGGFVAGTGFLIALFFLTGAVCCFLSARWMSARKNRTFSLVVAALTCLSIPLGTVLGVFTLVVLQKPEADELYAQNAALPPV